MRVVFFIKNRHLSASGIGIQVFIDGVRVEIDAINGISDAYGGKWNEEHTAFIIPNVPKDAIEIKDKTLTIHEPKKEVMTWTGWHT